MTDAYQLSGLDTSVVLRLLIGEPPDQAKIALQFVQDEAAKGRPSVASDLVVVEAYFALYSHYGVPKENALRTLLQLLESGLVAPEPGGASVLALKATLHASKKMGFADRLIHARYKSLSATMITFEKAASRLPDTRVLKT